MPIPKWEDSTPVTDIPRYEDSEPVGKTIPKWEDSEPVTANPPVAARPAAVVPEPVGLNPPKLAEFTQEQISKVQEPTAANLTKMATSKLTTPAPMQAAARGLTHGSLGLAESVGTGLQYVGAVDLGDKVEKYWGEKAKAFEADPRIQGSIVENPGLLKDPSWWTYNLAEMTPSFAAAMVPGVAAGKYIKIGGQAVKFAPATVEWLAKLGTPLVAGVSGGALEGANTYKVARDMGLKSGLSKDEAHEQARIAASQMTAASAALNAISFGKMLSGKVGPAKAVKHVLQSALTEAGTEWAEEPSEAIILERLKKDPSLQPIIDAMVQGVNVIPVTLLMGGLGAGGSLMAQRQANVAQGDGVAAPGAVPPGGGPAGPVAQPRPVLGSFEGTVLEFKIKTAMGLKPADHLTPEAVNAAFAAGKIPQDLAEQMGHPGALQAAQVEAAKNAPPAPALAPEEAMIQQVVADKTKTHEALSEPHPVTGQKPYQMSEQQYGAALRELDPNISGEEIAKSYEKLLADAKDVQLVDDRDIEMAMDPAQQAEALDISDQAPADYDFDLMDAGPASLSAMPLDELRAKFPEMGEQLHRELVVEGLNAGQITPEQAPYADIKKAAIERVNQEQVDVETRQKKSGDHPTPILQMAWKRKFNRAAFAKEGFDLGALRGFFTEKGGLTPEQATENAYEMGWIPEYDQAQFFEKLDGEMMKREGVIRSPEVPYHPGSPSSDPTVLQRLTSARQRLVSESDRQYLSVPFDSSIARHSVIVKAKETALPVLKKYGVSPDDRQGVVALGWALMQQFHDVRGSLTPVFLARQMQALGENLPSGYVMPSPEQVSVWQAQFEALSPDVTAINRYQKLAFARDSELSAGMDESIFNKLKSAYDVMPGNRFLASPGQEYTPATAPAFYSKLTKTIEAKMSGPMPAEQLLGLVKSAGIKQDELDWFDLPRLLKDNPKPTKQQVLDYLRANQLEIKEVVKGGGENQKISLSAAVAKLSPIFKAAGYEIDYDPLYEEGGPFFSKDGEDVEYSKLPRNLQEASSALEGQVRIGESLKETDTKFERYQLPGGENYREILFILPGRDEALLSADEIPGRLKTAIDENDNSHAHLTYIDRIAALDGLVVTWDAATDLPLVKRKLGGPEFTQSHWSEANVLAHMRLNDRTIDGKRTLFLEEVQSDWHQKGRDKGYEGEWAPLKTMPKSVVEYLKAEYPHVKPHNIEDSYMWKASESVRAEYHAWRREYSAAFQESTDKVPDAPLKKTWHEFVMKRAIRMAAEEGYDAIAWTTGEQQAERYDLSKQVEHIDYRTQGHDRFELGITAINGDTINLPKDDYSAAELPDVVGKEVAAKIINHEGVFGGGRGTLSNIDLKIGGEGMKGFYDRMLPGFVGKFTKKWGGKVVDATVLVPGYNEKGYENEDFTAHSLAITPELKQAAMAEGFPLFSPGHVYTPGEMYTDEAGAGADTGTAVRDVRGVRPVGQWHDLRQNPAIAQINKDFIEKQLTTAIGKKISTIQDAAEIAALARHPRIEHLVVVNLKKGKVIGSLVLTDGKIGYIDPNMAVIQAFLQDADEFYLSHNHPTGNATPSVDDIASTKLMAADKRFKGHVVTDHQTYTAISPDGTAIAQEFRGEKQSFRIDIEKMSTAPAVVGWVHGTLQGDKLGIMFVDPQKQVMSFDQVDPRSDYNAYIMRKAPGYGATGAFLVAGSSAASTMRPQSLGGNYHDFLVIFPDGSYRSAALGALPGFVVAETGIEGHFVTGRFLETPADYNPEDYNKVLGRFKPGMALTLRNRLVAPQFPAGLPRGTVFELKTVAKTGEMLVAYKGKILTVAVTPNMFKETYREPGAPQPGQKERQFIDTVRGMEKTNKTVKDTIAGNYDVITNEVTLAEAKAIIAGSMDRAIKLVNDTKEPTRLSNTVAMLLIDAMQQQGRFEEAIGLIEHTAERNTGAGQAIQALAMYRRLTPEGILRFADSVIRKAQDAFGGLVDELRGLTTDEARAAFAKKHKIPYMSGQQASELYDAAVAVAKMEPGRARDLATGKMLLKVSQLVPKTFWEKVSSLQILAQLLNPKTFVRNLIGNAAFMAFENFSQAAGVPLDMLVGTVTGKRTIGMPAFMTQASGFLKGAKEGGEEALAGIDLKQVNNKFDLPRGSAFDSRAMRALEALLNISLKATDRAFYQAAFEDSLRVAMKQAKVAAPTPEMVSQAHLDGLYRTFNDDNALRTALVHVKRSFNLNQKWGLGDMVIKYPGTPASILMRGIEYSPFGFMQAVYTLAKAGSVANFDQRAFVQQTTRALNGSLLLVGTGMILSALGLIRGKDDDKRAIREAEAAIGVRDYQINLSGLIRFAESGMDPAVAKMRKGDKLVSYDWMQPMAINLAMGANIQRGVETSGSAMIADALQSASMTLEEQPLLAGISRFFSGRSLTKGVEATIKAIPASFVPTLANQFRQLIDNVSRNTQSDSYLDAMGNQVKMKVPGLSGDLPPRVDVLGRVRKTYQNDTNNPFNVFLNPAFVNRYEPTPTTELVLDIWARSGETIQLPRIAPRQIKVRGVTRPLSEMEQAQFQHYIGERTAMAFTGLARNPDFLAAPDHVKAKHLQRVLTDIYYSARVNVLGVPPR